MNGFKSGYVPGGVSGLLGTQKPSSKTEQHEGLAKLFSTSPKQNVIKKKKESMLQIANALPEMAGTDVKSDRNSADAKRKKKKRKSDSETLLAREAAFEEGTSPHKKKKTKKENKTTVKDLPKPDPMKDARTIFVGNLPVEIEKKELKKLFRPFGKIESIRFRSAAAAELKIPKKVAVIKKAFHPKKGNINAYIVFKEEESALKSLKMNSHTVQGMHIHVDLAKKEEKHNHSRSIFVGNLPFDVQEEALREHFEDCGGIENVRVIRDKKTGLGKGFGYVLFQEGDSITLALGMASSQEKFQGRQLRIARSAENPTKVSNPKANQKMDHATSSMKKMKKEKVSKDGNQGKTKGVQKERNSEKVESENKFLGSVAHGKKKNISQKKQIKQKSEKKKKESLGSYLVSSKGSKENNTTNNKSQITDIRTLTKHQRKKLRRKEQSSNQQGVKRKLGNQIFARNRMSKKMKK